MAIEACNHGHTAPRAVLGELPESQAAPGRHACAICAYVLGQEQALRPGTDPGVAETCKHGQGAPKAVISELPESQAGTGRHRCVVCAYAVGLTAGLADLSIRLFPDELIEGDTTFSEGASKRVVVNKYERDPAARRKCVEHYGCNCSVCGMSFEGVYGELGGGFIHVHHLTPVSELGDAGTVDPMRDLRPVCPNCHAMLHQQNPPHRVEWLREQLGLRGSQINPKR